MATVGGDTGSSAIITKNETQLKDPTLTDEENNANLNRMLERLQQAAEK